jgi:hypothetical protein
MIVPVPVEAQVPPLGIEGFDEGHLLFPPPTLDLFFSMDCVADIRVPRSTPAERAGTCW